MQTRLLGVAVLLTLISGFSAAESPVATISIKPVRFDNGKAGVMILLSSQRHAMNYRYGILWPDRLPPQKPLPGIPVTDGSETPGGAIVVQGLPTTVVYEHDTGKGRWAWEGLLFDRQIHKIGGATVRLWAAVPLDTLETLRSDHGVESVCIYILAGDMRFRGEAPHSRIFSEEISLKSILEAPQTSYPVPAPAPSPIPPQPRRRPGDIAT